MVARTERGVRLHDLLGRFVKHGDLMDAGRAFLHIVPKGDDPFRRLTIGTGSHDRATIDHRGRAIDTADAEWIQFIDFRWLIRISRQIVQNPAARYLPILDKIRARLCRPCAHPGLNPAGRAETAEFDSLTGNSEPSAPGQTANGAV